MNADVFVGPFFLPPPARRFFLASFSALRAFLLFRLGGTGFGTGGIYDFGRKIVVIFGIGCTHRYHIRVTPPTSRSPYSAAPPSCPPSPAHEFSSRFSPCPRNFFYVGESLSLLLSCGGMGTLSVVSAGLTILRCSVLSRFSTFVDGRLVFRPRRAWVEAQKYARQFLTRGYNLRYNTGI